MIDLAALRSLIAVQDHGSVVAAAEALGFTPSAVSQQIKRLEQQSRVPLLERVGRGVVLTDRARLLVERGGDVLDDLEEIAHVLRGEETVLRGPFHLATFSTGNRGLVAPAVAGLLRAAPEVHLTVIEDDPQQVLDLVARGQADAGLVHDWTSMRLEVHPGVDTASVLDDRGDVVLHRSHPLAQAEHVTPLQLAGDRWACTPAGTICHAWLIQMFAGHGLRPDLRYFAEDYATHVAMVAEGLAVGLVPRLGRGALPDEVVAVPVVDPTPRRDVQLAWRRSSTGNPVRQRLLAELRAVADALP